MTVWRTDFVFYSQVRCGALLRTARSERPAARAPQRAPRSARPAAPATPHLSATVSQSACPPPPSRAGSFGTSYNFVVALH